MKAKTINEIKKFERGMDPKEAMGTGIADEFNMMAGMSAFTHWLYNVDHRFVRLIWGDTLMGDHIEAKWKGILSKSKESYMDPNSLMKLVRELDDENRKMLYAYIVKNHKGRWT